MHTLVALLFSVILLSVLREVSSFSMGAPDSACQGKFRPRYNVLMITSSDVTRPDPGS